MHYFTDADSFPDFCSSHAGILQQCDFISVTPPFPLQCLFSHSRHKIPDETCLKEEGSASAYSSRWGYSTSWQGRYGGRKEGACHVVSRQECHKLSTRLILPFGSAQDSSPRIGATRTQDGFPTCQPSKEMPHSHTQRYVLLDPVQLIIITHYHDCECQALGSCFLL